MNEPPHNSATPDLAIATSRSWPWSLGTILLIAIAVTLARICYLWLLCPYSLVEDEAQYWEWSRRLGWSYYSKGPGVAWLIRVMIEVFGTSEASIRMGAAISGGITAFAVGGLTLDISRSRRAALYAIACVLLAPFMVVSSLLMTIDAPYIACWTVACWAAWRAMRHHSTLAWIALGAAIGVGFLFKYTVLLLPPGLLAFAVLARWHARRSEGDEAQRRSSPLAVIACVGVALLGLAPVILWNASHDWSTVRHLLGHLRLEGGDVMPTTPGSWSYEPRWTLEFIGAQLALIGPSAFLMAYGAWAALRTRTSQPHTWPGNLFLMCCAAPILLFYLGVTFINEAEGNWPAAGYVTLFALAARYLDGHMSAYHTRVREWLALPKPRPRRGWFRRKPQTATQIAWHATVVIGLIVAIGSLRLDWAAVPINAVYSALAKPPSREVGASGARRSLLLPIYRLTGGPELGREVHALAEQLRERTGMEPFHIVQHYGRASVVAFYLPGRPIVYCASSRLGGRKTQWDFWPDTDLDNMALLEGRPAVLSGAELQQWEYVFSTVEDLGVLKSEPRNHRRSFLGLDYRGFPRSQPAP